MAKLYQFRIKEQNGEQQYTHTEYVVASNLKQATQFAYKYASNWYSGAKWDSYLGGWSIDFGAVAWKIDGVSEANPITIHWHGAQHGAGGKHRGGMIFVDVSKEIEKQEVG